MGFHGKSSYCVATPGEDENPFFLNQFSPFRKGGEGDLIEKGNDFI